LVVVAVVRRRARVLGRFGIVPVRAARLTEKRGDRVVGFIPERLRAGPRRLAFRQQERRHAHSEIASSLLSACGASLDARAFAVSAALGAGFMICVGFE
jgi:hypothetical protein